MRIVHPNEKHSIMQQTLLLGLILILGLTSCEKDNDNSENLKMNYTFDFHSTGTENWMSFVIAYFSYTNRWQQAKKNIRTLN